MRQATMKRNEATGELIVIRQVHRQATALVPGVSSLLFQASIMEALRRIGWKEELASGT
jgi:hypothetical protein